VGSEIRHEHEDERTVDQQQRAERAPLRQERDRAAARRAEPERERPHDPEREDDRRGHERGRRSHHLSADSGRSGGRESRRDLLRKQSSRVGIGERHREPADPGDGRKTPRVDDREQASKRGYGPEREKSPSPHRVGGRTVVGEPARRRQEEEGRAQHVGVEIAVEPREQRELGRDYERLGWDDPARVPVAERRGRGREPLDPDAEPRGDRFRRAIGKRPQHRPAGGFEIACEADEEGRDHACGPGRSAAFGRDRTGEPVGRGHDHRVEACEREVVRVARLRKSELREQRGEEVAAVVVLD